jgi:Tfp pilus assembly protein PilF
MAVRRVNRDRQPQGGNPGLTALRPAVVGRSALAPVLVTLSVLLVACSSASTPASPQATAAKLVDLGIKAQASGDLALALKDYAGATGADPADAYAYYDLGVVYQQKNDSANAVAEYNKALLADPTYQPAMYNFATVETSTNPTLAIFEYNQLLRLNPHDANASFNLGLLLIAQNQSAAGLADLKKAIQISPALAKRLPAGITP